MQWIAARAGEGCRQLQALLEGSKRAVSRKVLEEDMQDVVMLLADLRADAAGQCGAEAAKEGAAERWSSVGLRRRGSVGLRRRRRVRLRRQESERGTLKPRWWRRVSWWLRRLGKWRPKRMGRVGPKRQGHRTLSRQGNRMLRRRRNRESGRWWRVVLRWQGRVGLRRRGQGKRKGAFAAEAAGNFVGCS